MGAIESRIEDLGLVLPEVATPLAAYVPAVRTGNLIYTSGQLPTRNGQLVATGRVSAELNPGTDASSATVDVETAKQAAAVAVMNALAAVKSVIGELDLVERVVKLNGFIACESSFTQHAVVMNGASELLGEIFGDRGKHARAAVGMSSLPLNAPVELELVVEVR